MMVGFLSATVVVVSMMVGFLPAFMVVVCL
jgi:hypothetical protein